MLTPGQGGDLAAAQQLTRAGHTVAAPPDQELANLRAVLHATGSKVHTELVACPVGTPFTRDFLWAGGEAFLVSHGHHLQIEVTTMRGAVMHAPGDVRSRTGPSRNPGADRRRDPAVGHPASAARTCGPTAALTR